MSTLLYESAHREFYANANMERPKGAGTVAVGVVRTDPWGKRPGSERGPGEGAGAGQARRVGQGFPDRKICVKCAKNWRQNVSVKAFSRNPQYG